MKRSKEGVQFLVYKYHCYPLPCGEKGNHWRPTHEMMAEAFRMRDYWNRLLDLAEENRKKYFSLLEEDQSLQEKQLLFREAQTFLNEAKDALKNARKIHRKKVFPEAETLSEIIKKAKETLVLRFDELRTATKETKENKRHEIESLYEEWNEILRQERKDATMGWGNREFILDHFRTAVFVAKGSKAELQRKRHIEEVNFTQTYSSGNMTWEKLQKSRGERVSIGELLEAKSNRQAPRFNWSMKIDREVTVPLQIAYSRALPDEAIIRSVTLHGKRIQRQWVRPLKLKTVIYNFAKHIKNALILQEDQRSLSILEDHLEKIKRRWVPTENDLSICRNVMTQAMSYALQLSPDEAQRHIFDTVPQSFLGFLKAKVYITEAERWRWSLHVAIQIDHLNLHEDIRNIIINFYNEDLHNVSAKLFAFLKKYVIWQDRNDPLYYKRIFNLISYVKSLPYEVVARQTLESQLISEFPKLIINRQPRCAINVGWAKIEEGKEIRVAMAVDDTGKEYELRLPRKMVLQYDQTRNLHEVLSGIDNNFAKDLDVLPLTSMSPETRKAIDVTLKETNIRTLSAVHRLLQHDPRYKDIFNDWLSRRSVFVNMIAGNHRRLRNWRTDIYRKWVRMLCLQYNEIIIGDVDYKKIAEEEKNNGRLEASMRYRQIVGPSFLVTDLKNMAKKLHVKIVETEPVNISITCPECTEKVERQTGERILMCPNGHTYDQDKGACINHLKRAA